MCKFDLIWRNNIHSDSFELEYLKSVFYEVDRAVGISDTHSCNTDLVIKSPENNSNANAIVTKIMEIAFPSKELIFFFAVCAEREIPFHFLAN